MSMEIGVLPPNMEANEVVEMGPKLRRSPGNALHRGDTDAYGHERRGPA
jgi:hypothetical protein